MAEDYKAGLATLSGLLEKSKFDSLSADDQKKLLDVANATIIAIGKLPQAEKDALKAQSDQFVERVKKDKAAYEAKTKTSYNFEADRASGDDFGKKFEKWMGDLPANIGNGMKSVTDGIGGLFSGKKGDEQSTATAPATTDAGKQKKYKHNKDGSLVLDKNGNPVEEGFFDNLDVGGLIGGVVGGIGGWFAGNLFGGGIIGKIAGALLAFGGFLLGQNALGKLINHWMGKDKETGTNGQIAGAASPAPRQNPAAVPPVPEAVGQSAVAAHDGFTPQQMEILDQAILDQSRVLDRVDYGSTTVHASDMVVPNVGQARQHGRPRTA